MGQSYGSNRRARAVAKALEILGLLSNHRIGSLAKISATFGSEPGPGGLCRIVELARTAGLPKKGRPGFASWEC